MKVKDVDVINQGEEETKGKISWGIMQSTKMGKNKKGFDDSYCMKLLENGLTQNGIEGVHDVHLNHHLIKMDI
jgi:O-glycosyl hydrolase